MESACPCLERLFHHRHPWAHRMHHLQHGLPPSTATGQGTHGIKRSYLKFHHHPEADGLAERQDGARKAATVQWGARSWEHRSRLTGVQPCSSQTVVRQFLPTVRRPGSLGVSAALATLTTMPDNLAATCKQIHVSKTKIWLTLDAINLKLRFLSKKCCINIFIFTPMTMHVIDHLLCCSLLFCISQTIFSQMLCPNLFLIS